MLGLDGQPDRTACRRCIPAGRSRPTSAVSRPGPAPCSIAPPSSSAPPQPREPGPASTSPVHPTSPPSPAGTSPAAGRRRPRPCPTTPPPANACGHAARNSAVLQRRNGNLQRASSHRRWRTWRPPLRVSCRSCNGAPGPVATTAFGYSESIAAATSPVAASGIAVAASSITSSRASGISRVHASPLPTGKNGSRLP
jgi:hypothetical protein